MQVFSRFKRNWSSRRLNKLAKVNGAARYLEIGVQDGKTFRKVRVPHKVAVDPAFRFTIPEDEHEYHQCTSDEYFEKAHGQFDLIFIDGLHEFEQTLRDFDNSLRHAGQSTIWLIDDVFPNDKYSILNDQDECIRRREEAGLGHDRRWHGDIFKVAFAIHDLRPEFSFATASEANAQTIVWKEARKAAPRFGSIAEIGALDYEEFVANQDLLKLMPEKKAISMVASEAR